MKIELGRTDANYVSVIITDDKNRSKELFLEISGNEVPVSHEVGNWVYLGAAYAMVCGEDLHIAGPLDPVSAHNVEALTAVWKSWYPYLRKPVITSEGFQSTKNYRNERCGSFFSGGLDSLFTLSKAGNFSFSQATASDIGISHLVKIWHGGNLINNEEYLVKRALFERTAELYGKRLVSVGTNLMTELPLLNDWWAFLTHGPAMATIPHVLSNEINTIILGSSHPVSQLIPWGSHPITDPLFSSSRLRVIHDGANYTRVEKTRSVGADPVAMSIINVCGAQFDARGRVLNCSRCQKCLRTMLALDLYGYSGADASPTFDWSGYRTSDASKIYLKARFEIMHMDELLNEAENLRRPDISKPLRSAIQRSRKFAFLGDTERFLRRRFPFVLQHKTELKAIRDKLQELLGLSRSVRAQVKSRPSVGQRYQSSDGTSRPSPH